MNNNNNGTFSGAGRSLFSRNDQALQNDALQQQERGDQETLNNVLNLINNDNKNNKNFTSQKRNQVYQSKEDNEQLEQFEKLIEENKELEKDKKRLVSEANAMENSMNSLKEQYSEIKKELEELRLFKKRNKKVKQNNFGNYNSSVRNSQDNSEKLSQEGQQNENQFECFNENEQEINQENNNELLAKIANLQNKLTNAEDEKLEAINEKEQQWIKELDALSLKNKELTGENIKFKDDISDLKKILLGLRADLVLKLPKAKEDSVKDKDLIKDAEEIKDLFNKYDAQVKQKLQEINQSINPKDEQDYQEIDTLFGKIEEGVENKEEQLKKNLLSLVDKEKMEEFKNKSISEIYTELSSATNTKQRNLEKLKEATNKLKELLKEEEEKEQVTGISSVAGKIVEKFKEQKVQIEQKDKTIEEKGKQIEDMKQTPKQVIQNLDKLKGKRIGEKTVFNTLPWRVSGISAQKALRQKLEGEIKKNPKSKQLQQYRPYLSGQFKKTKTQKDLKEFKEWVEDVVEKDSNFVKRLKPKEGPQRIPPLI